MNLDKYQIRIDEDFLFFRFVSDGNLGRINKVIQYDKMSNDVYNLGFGDENPLTGQVDDTVVTNNGDMTKILATVASSIYVFTQRNKNAWVYVTGSSQSRIRLYRMAINKYVNEISEDFVVYASLENGEWYPFESNINTKEFLIRRKI